MKIPKRMQGVKGKAHAFSPKQEKSKAKNLGGVVVKGSGCGYTKGDVRVEGLLRLECKCTTKKSFSITHEILDKIEDAACSAGELPFVEVAFLDTNGVELRSIAICPTWVLEGLKRSE